MKPGSEYTYAGLSTSLCRGLLERPWLPSTMWKEFFQRSLAIGVRAAPTVFLMAGCVGFVIALVLQLQLSKMSMEDRVPKLIWIIMNQQLAPMLTAVVFIGRSVSGSAAELANMKIAEEIKALETMGVDVSRYLLLPMLGAFLIMLPVMEIYTLGVGLLGAYGVSAKVMGMTSEQFVLRALEGAQIKDVLLGVREGGDLFGDRGADRLPQGTECERWLGCGGARGDVRGGGGAGGGDGGERGADGAAVGE